MPRNKIHDKPLSPLFCKKTFGSTSSVRAFSSRLTIGPSPPPPDGLLLPLLSSSSFSFWALHLERSGGEGAELPYPSPPSVLPQAKPTAKSRLSPFSRLRSHSRGDRGLRSTYLAASVHLPRIPQNPEERSRKELKKRLGARITVELTCSNSKATLLPSPLSPIVPGT